MKTTPLPFQRETTRAVTVLELLVAISLVSFIILALYQMFDRTQAQMRRAVRETDKYESGRSTMDIIRRDLTQLGYVKTLYNSGHGAIATNWNNILFAPAGYSAATYYQPGSLVNSGGSSYFALAPSSNFSPASTNTPNPWALAAPNLRISSLWNSSTPTVMRNAGGAILQTNFIHDLFFMYFDPNIRTTRAPSGQIQPGVSYLASNTITSYNGAGYPAGSPFYGVAGVNNYLPTVLPGNAVQIEGGWRAVGYRVASSTNALYPLSTTPGLGTLYRYELGTYNNDATRMWYAINNFAANSPASQTNLFRRVADNVVHFKCTAYANNSTFPVGGGDVLFFGTNVPRYVELELGILDSKVAAQAQGMVAGTNTAAAAAFLYLQGDAVQVFRLQLPVRIGQ